MSTYSALYRLTASLRASYVTRHAARALNRPNKKNIMLTVRSIAENIAESIAFIYIGETHGQNSEVNVGSKW